jgi:predicted nucleic acid-binding Zn ribbon protein
MSDRRREPGGPGGRGARWRGGRGWRAPDPVAEPGAARRPGDPTPVGPVLDRLLAGLGAPPAAAVTALFERWNELAGLPLADHAVPGSLEAGVLVVKVDDPLWATEWRYRQGEVLRRCDDLLGPGVVARIDVRVRR